MINSFVEFHNIFENENSEISSLVIRTEIKEEVILELLEKSPELKVVLAKNKHLSEKVIIELSKDSDSDVRYWIAMKRKAPVHVLERLANDESEDVRRRVVNNKKVNKTILSYLEHDKVFDIAEKARQRLSERDYK